MPTPVPQPVPPPPLTEPALPISDLGGFLAEVQGLFDNIVYYWDQLLFKRDFRQSIREAWGDLRQRVGGVIGNLGLPQLREGLRDAGLDGRQLSLKLAAINDVWTRFSKRGLVSLLQDVLEWVEVSLTASPPSRWSS